MTKTIITQNGDIINLNSLFAIYVDTARNSNTNKQHFELRAEGFMGHPFVIGTYSDRSAAVHAKAEIICWLQNEAYATFEVAAA